MLPPEEEEQAARDLASDDEATQVRASKWFWTRAKSGDFEALKARFTPALVENLGDPSPLVRRWAARVLQTFGDENVDAIHRAAQAETDSIAKQELAGIVAQMRGKRAGPYTPPKVKPPTKTPSKRNSCIKEWNGQKVNCCVRRHPGPRCRADACVQAGGECRPGPCGHPRCTRPGGKVIPHTKY